MTPPKKKTLVPILIAAAVALGVACTRFDSRDQPYSPSRSGAMDDAALTTKVKTAFIADPSVSALVIDVDSHGGVVTLTGTVGAPSEKALAERIARHTQGVRDVVNRLSVEGPSADRSVGDTITDAALTASVKTSLAIEKGVKASDIDVDTSYGVVTLYGNVRSGAEARLAERTTRKVAGVREVVNHLRVSSS
jgi:hyperosmotically inducible protein